VLKNTIPVNPVEEKQMSKRVLSRAS